MPDPNRQQLNYLLTRFLKSRSNLDRSALIEYLSRSPLTKITAQRMNERYGHLIRGHVGYLEYEDLVSVAQMAMVKIVDDFNPSLSRDFEKCVINRMRQAILQEIRHGFRGGRGAMENVSRRIYEVSLDHEQDSWNGEAPTRAETIASHDESPWVALQRSDIRAAVLRLPEPERTVIIYKIFKGLSIEEGGASLDPPVPRTTATDAYHRGLSTLAKTLAEYEDGLDAVE